MESQIQVAQDTRGERVKHVRFVFRRESIRSPVRKQENIQVRSRQIYHEDVKFYTIDNGMCVGQCEGCLLYTSPSPRDGLLSRMPSSA